jgi:hypothetical protein
MENYFNKFPNISYTNKNCVDITKRVTFGKNEQRKTNLYYKYDVENNLRSDQIAGFYYQDPTYDWMVLLQNGIVDPYYGWYLSEEDFNSFINEKYGSFENSLKKIKHYKLDWANSDDEISKSFYENTLAYDLRKYYAPVYSTGSTIISYTRRQEDWVINTNKIIKLNVSSYVSGNSFIDGELIDIKSSLNNDSANGTGEVISSNSTTVFIKNTSGYTTNNYYVVGESSNTSAQFSTSNTVVQNISDSESVYWIPITCYEYERGKNEKNKTIRLINADLALSVAEQLRTKMLE